MITSISSAKIIKNDFTFTILLLYSITLIAGFGVLPKFELPKLLILIFTGSTLIFVIIKKYWAPHFSQNRRAFLVTFGYAIALIIVAINTDQSFQVTLLGASGRYTGLLAQLSYLVIFLYAICSTRLENVNFSLKAILYLSYFLTFYGFIQAINLDPIEWNLSDNLIILTLGNTNFSGALIAMCSSLTIYFLLISHKHWKSLLLHLFFLFCQCLLLFKLGDQALQGLVLLLLSAYLIFTLYLFFRFEGNQVISKIWSITSILMLILIFASGFSNQGPLGSIFRTSSLIDRFYSWKIGIEMFKDNLFFGVGLDSYGDWYPFYRTQEIIDFRGLPPEITSFNPHNSLISAASGGGLILLISYIGINIFILFCGLRAIRFQENKFRTSVIFVFWVLFQIQTLISIDSHGISVWGWFVAGILVKLSYNQSEQLKSSKTGNKSLTRMLLIAIFIIVQAPSLYMLNYYSYNVRHLNLLNSFNKKMDVVTFNNNLNNLLILDSRIYQAEINDVTLRLLASLKREDLALEVAIDMTQKYPRRLNGWDAVARIYEFQGKYIEARPYRLKTIELDPLNKVYKSKLVS